MGITDGRHGDGPNQTPEPSPADVPEAFQRSRLWQPDLIVFVSSGCIMILELVAGRIIAPYVGVSLYTWTSVIGVVLAGISLGNYLGGWLADRSASLRLLGGILLLAGLASCGILAVDALGGRLPGNWPIVVEILVLTAALFLVPCIILGTISPIVAKLAVRDLARTGRTVGRIYAAGSVGSIAGTFATGFVLISWLGTHIIVWGVAVTLLLMGLLFLVRGQLVWMALGTLLLAGGTLLVTQQGWLSGPCTRETNYFCIKVHEEERDGGAVQILTLDRLVHSYTSLDDPTKLVYGYEQIYAELTAYRAQSDDHLAALFIGGGGYTFPRYMEALYPGSDIHVVEIDPGVTAVAHDLLGLSQDSAIVTYNQDARFFLEQPPVSTYDLVMGDAFNDFSVPYHLTTKGFNDRVRAWLAADGLYFVNIIDGPRSDFLRAYIHTLRQTFRHVYVAPTIESWREATRSTFVLIASDAPLDLTALESLDAGDGFALLAERILSPREVDSLLDEGRLVTLTDRYAPVDQMLAPVFREEVSR
ncbi:MAG: fused MFS/spermidine synthase [Anaerolineae bacterium]|nr:fused MFS/spermidine synthase [Anaerolineae bacterium]